jgi:hypothetical protein
MPPYTVIQTNTNDPISAEYMAFMASLIDS